jgi:hypothetical protein
MKKPRVEVDARALTLIAKVAAALAAYDGQPATEKHIRLATKVLRQVLRKAPEQQPDVESLIA